jgi:hypothetical protein
MADTMSERIELAEEVVRHTKECVATRTVRAALGARAAGIDAMLVRYWSVVFCFLNMLSEVSGSSGWRSRYESQEASMAPAVRNRANVLIVFFMVVAG